MANRKELEITRELDEHCDNKINNKPAGPGSVQPIEDYVTPLYNITLQSEKYVQDFTYDVLNNDDFASIIPKELIVEIFLPPLESSATVKLGATSEMLKLVCEIPPRYKLDIVLPYGILKDNCSARFQNINHRLEVTLPVDRTNARSIVELKQEVSPNDDYHSEDSGVESDHSQLTEVSRDKTTVEKAPLTEGITDLVESDNCSAKFENINPKPVVTLPVNRTDAPTGLEVNQEVNRTNDYHREDSGVENDHSPLTEVSKDKTTVEKAPLTEEITDLVESDNCSAKFDNINHTLVITLPVNHTDAPAGLEVNRTNESDHSPLTEVSKDKTTVKKGPLTEEITDLLETDNCLARFENINPTLVVTLPVNHTEAPNVLEVNQEVSPNNDYHREDSGVVSDHSPLTEVPKDNKTTVEKAPLTEETTDLVESKCVIESKTIERKSRFLNKDKTYIVPDFTFDMTEGDLYFTLNVRNVVPSSIVKSFDESHTLLHIKFEAFTQTFCRSNYAFCVKFPDWIIDVDNVVIDLWEKNVVVEIPNDASNEKLPDTFFLGTDEDTLEEMEIECLEPEQESSGEVSADCSETYIFGSHGEQSNKTDTDDTRTIPNKESPKTDAVPIAQSIQKKRRPFSGSSIEYSFNLSLSPPGSTLTLDRPVTRRPGPRMSRSSLMAGSSSFEQCGSKSESFIPDDSEEWEEISPSLKKKPIRFKDATPKKVFGGNSSILGRRKTNQRKRRNKRRAQKRRVRASKTSKAKDKKNLNSGQQDEFKPEAGDYSKEQSKSDENLDCKTDLTFDVDM